MLQRSIIKEAAHRDNFISSLRLMHKVNRENKEKEPPKVASDVINYLQSSAENRELIDRLPKTLLRKYKTPESMYLINRNTAKVISKTIKDHLDTNSPLIEVNPGLGLLSQELLECQSGHIYMYESLNSFSSNLNVSVYTLITNVLNFGFTDCVCFL